MTRKVGAYWAIIENEPNYTDTVATFDIITTISILTASVVEMVKFIYYCSWFGCDLNLVSLVFQGCFVKVIHACCFSVVSCF